MHMWIFICTAKEDNTSFLFQDIKKDIKKMKEKKKKACECKRFFLNLKNSQASSHSKAFLSNF